MTAPLRIDVLTLFPRMFDSPFAESIVARAREAGRLVLEVHDIRLGTRNKHHFADEHAVRRGAGMVLSPRPSRKRASRAVPMARRPPSAQGRLFDQAAARRLARWGIWSRVRSLRRSRRARRGIRCPERLSIGDYVLR